MVDRRTAHHTRRPSPTRLVQRVTTVRATSRPLLGVSSWSRTATRESPPSALPRRQSTAQRWRVLAEYARRSHRPCSTSTQAFLGIDQAATSLGRRRKRQQPATKLQPPRQMRVGLLHQFSGRKRRPDSPAIANGPTLDSRRRDFRGGVIIATTPGSGLAPPRAALIEAGPLDWLARLKACEPIGALAGMVAAITGHRFGTALKDSRHGFFYRWLARRRSVDGSKVSRQTKEKDN